MLKVYIFFAILKNHFRKIFGLFFNFSHCVLWWVCPGNACRSVRTYKYVSSARNSRLRWFGGHLQQSFLTQYERRLYTQPPPVRLKAALENTDEYLVHTALISECTRTLTYDKSTIQRRECCWLVTRPAKYTYLTVSIC